MLLPPPDPEEEAMATRPGVQRPRLMVTIINLQVRAAKRQREKVREEKHRVRERKLMLI